MVLYSLWMNYSLSVELDEYREFKSKLMTASDSFLILSDSVIIESIEYIDQYNEEHNLIYKEDLLNHTDSLLAASLNQYSQKLKTIQDQIVVKNKELNEIKVNRQRAINNLPEIVSLDELYEKYREDRSESFYTSKGTISFRTYNIRFMNVPSTNEIASIRIGKEDSDEKSALIKAFLDEAADSKRKQGYVLTSNKEVPTDYGSYRIKTYTKGDGYFTTYYEYTRYQGTYNSTYLRYNYYIEIGSKSRSKQFKTEQFNSKLGS